MHLTDVELVLDRRLTTTQAIADAVCLSYERHRGWCGRSCYGPADALAWIAGDFGAVHSFVIVDPSGRLVGTCGLNDHDVANKRPTSLLVTDRRHWIRLRQCATRLVANFGIELAKYRRLEIVVAVGNEKSRRVRRLGATALVA
ncbi:MAG: GNAT family N-acetyltransferase [Acidimicrobiales bacterium]